MHNFPLHLCCVSTLPENELRTERARCLPVKSLGGSQRSRLDHGIVQHLERVLE